MPNEDLARTIKAVISDVDGIFTNNTVPEGLLLELPAQPPIHLQPKWRSYYDGQGVSLLRAISIRVALITNEKGGFAQKMVDKWNALPSSSKTTGDGGWEHVRLFSERGGVRKTDAAEEFLKKINVGFDDCAYIGDDLVDVDLLKKVVLPAAPVSADPTIKDYVVGRNGYISDRPGGSGAFRDFANWILKCRGIDPFSLPPQ